MRTKISLLLTSLIICISCSQETQQIELTNPGFGVIASSIDIVDEGFDLPVLLQSDDIIKGVQFTLSWDPAVAQVIQPAMTAANAGFSISSSDGERGEMKVLIFSMAGDVLNTTDPTILTIAIRIIDPEAELFELSFNDAIFAGPNAVSYAIPITHAKLKVNHK